MTAAIAFVSMLYDKSMRPVERPPRDRPNLASAFLIGLEKIPSSETSESRFNKLAFGILTLSNKINPLSMPSRPYFRPQSPIVIPGKGR